MLFSVICNENNCANNGIEYLMPNPAADVMCGGCKQMITATATDIPEPETPDFINTPLFSL